MKTALALTLVLSGVIVRVCLNLHHFFTQPVHVHEEYGDSQMENIPMAALQHKEEPTEIKEVKPQVTKPKPAIVTTPIAETKTHAFLAEAKFSEQCQQGDFRSCQQDFLQKKKWCEEGNLIDCNTLAWMYLEGAPGIKSDSAAAIALFDNACNRGGRLACTSLGDIYKNGKATIKKDEEKSIEYYKKNCTTGNASNCYELAILYYDGKGTLADKDNVVSLMVQSCDDNQLKACKWLAENNVAEISPSKTALNLR